MRQFSILEFTKEEAGAYSDATKGFFEKVQDLLDKECPPAPPQPGWTIEDQKKAVGPRISLAKNFFALANFMIAEAMLTGLDHQSAAAIEQGATREASKSILSAVQAGVATGLEKLKNA